MSEYWNCRSKEDDAGVLTLSFVSFEVSASISVPLACSLEVLKAFLPPGREPFEGSDVDRAYSVTCLDEGRADSKMLYRLHLRGRVLAEFMDFKELCSAFESDLSIAIATESSHGLVFVHAGVVAIDDRALVFPGESRSGKSTLLRALVEQGAVYYSDEFAVFDEQGRVHPYARDPSFRGQNPWVIGSKFPLESLGGELGTRAIPVGGILGCRFVAGSDWNCPVVSSGRGVIMLLENAVAAQLYPEKTFRTLSRAADGCVVREGTRGEADRSAVEVFRFFPGYSGRKSGDLGGRPV